jgi:predicted metal-binding membrane protein
MVVLVLAASMSLLWAGAIAAVVFAQKVLPLGETTMRVTGATLIFAAVATAFG